jgi:hypothetical protein
MNAVNERAFRTLRECGTNVLAKVFSPRRHPR